MFSFASAGAQRVRSTEGKNSQFRYARFAYELSGRLREYPSFDNKHLAVWITAVHAAGV